MRLYKRAFSKKWGSPLLLLLFLYDELLKSHIFKKTFICFVFLPLIVFRPLKAGSEENPQTEILNSFKKWYSNVNMLKADFNQSTFNPVWGEEQKAMGNVYFKKPGYMRWEYTSPHKDIIIVNDEGFFWYTPEDNQVIKKNTEEAFQAISPMSILGENMNIEKDFTILGIEEIKGEKEGTALIGYTILLKPKNPQVSIKKIGIQVMAEGFSLAAIEVEEQSGSHNRIEFKNTEINPALKPDLFIFTPLPGIKIITPNDLPVLN